MMNKVDCILVSVDFSRGEDGKDHEVMVVGRQKPGKPVKIINAFQGEEVKKLYEKLITKKGNTDNGE